MGWGAGGGGGAGLGYLVGPHSCAAVEAGAGRWGGWGGWGQIIIALQGIMNGLLLTGFAVSASLLYSPKSQNGGPGSPNDKEETTRRWATRLDFVILKRSRAKGASRARRKRPSDAEIGVAGP